MAEIGSAVYIDSYNYLRAYAAELQVDTANNRSLIQYGLNLHVAGRVTSNNIDVWIRGQQNYIGYHNYGAGTHTLIDRTEWVTHNADGSGSANIYWAFNSAIGNWEGQTLFNLTKINRYPVLNSGSNFTDRTNPVFNITAYNTYPLKVKLEAGGNSSLITRMLSSQGSQIYTLELTKEERKTLRDLSPDGKTLAVRETVCAMSGSTELSFSYKDYTMTIEKRPAKIRINGEDKDALAYVRINGEWKETKPYIRVNGEWKEEI